MRAPLRRGFFCTSIQPPRKSKQPRNHTTTLEAAKQRGIARVELHVREHNQRAIALYEKFGFVREGLMRRDVFVDGVYENSLLMAVLFESLR